MHTRIPELIEVSKIAKAIGWPSVKTRVFLRDSGMSFQVSKRKEYVIFRDEFECKMPKVYKIFVDKYLSGCLITYRGKYARDKL
jgi:hypothetical protein